MASMSTGFNVKMVSPSPKAGFSKGSFGGCSRKDIRTVTSVIFREVRSPLHNAVLALQNIASIEHFIHGSKLTMEWNALNESLAKITTVLTDLMEYTGRKYPGEFRDSDTDIGLLKACHSRSSTPKSEDNSSDSQSLTDHCAHPLQTTLAPPDPPSTDGPSRRWIVTCNNDSDRKPLTRSRSLDDSLPAVDALPYQVMQSWSFADEAAEQNAYVPRPSSSTRGISDVTKFLRRLRHPSSLPSSSSTVEIGKNFLSSSTTLALPSASTASTSAAMGMGNGLHVLVVDDDVLTRKLMERKLHRMGCAVDTAENGRVALEKIASSYQTAIEHSNRPGTYDIVFLDNQMPVMSGLDAVSSLRSFGRGDLVVGVTGDALLSEQQEFLSAGADHVLTKPVFESNLLDVIQFAQQRRLRAIPV